MEKAEDGSVEGRVEMIDEDRESIDRHGRNIPIYIAATERNDVFISAVNIKKQNSLVSLTLLIIQPFNRKKKYHRYCFSDTLIGMYWDGTLLYCWSCSSSKLRAEGLRSDPLRVG